jgi:hypothetical protein
MSTPKLDRSTTGKTSLTGPAGPLTTLDHAIAVGAADIYQQRLDTGDSPAQAMAVILDHYRREVIAYAQPAVIHPETGELLENLRELPSETLAETLDAIHRRQRTEKEMCGALEGELRQRLALKKRKLMPAGDWEVAVESSNEAVWDVDDLEEVLEDLVEDGTLQPRELAGVVTHEAVVHRTEINKVVARLTGDAKSALEACRTWRKKGPGRIRVTRSVVSITEESEQ